MEDRLRRILHRLCDSLGMFIKTVQNSIGTSTTVIKGKTRRSKNFDDYVTHVEAFNKLLTRTTVNIKHIVIALSVLYVEKSLERLTLFLKRLQEFIEFIVAEEVFTKLIEIRDKLNISHNKYVEMMNHVIMVKHIIFNIFGISFNITSMFFPQLSLLNPVLDKISKHIDCEVKDETMPGTYDDISDIITSLSDIQIRVESIANLDTELIMQCIHNINDDQLYKDMETLEKDYSNMDIMMHSLQSEINMYKQRKQKKWYMLS